MSHYLMIWGHMYLIHFGAWITFSIGCTVHREGVPSPKALPELFKSATVLSLFLSIVSSQSHAHYLNTLTDSFK